MIKASIIGLGHLGGIHLKLLNESKDFDVIGYHDYEKKDPTSINNCVFFEDVEALILGSDVVFICTNTPNHFKYALICLENNKHVFWIFLEHVGKV